MSGRRRPEPAPGGVTLTFAEDELDALIAALALLRRETGAADGYDDFDGEEEGSLADLAGLLLGRIEAALPAEVNEPAPRARKGDGPHHAVIRQAIRAETRLALDYVDRKDKASRRVVWPIELGHVGAGETIGAWCESRRDFRHFRLDRIRSLTDTGQRYPERRRILAARLRLAQSEQWF